MDIPDMKLMKENVAYDDRTLVKMYKKILCETETRKTRFEEQLHDPPEDDYIRVTVSRLAYIFAKEEHDTLLEEMKKRGLLT